MDVRSLSGIAVNASITTQRDLKTLTQRLSSGLRINTAADDPSGLAIAESLTSKVQGLDEGTRQIQNAANALTVADGAMASISSLLQRMRTLVVEARSQLESASDQSDIQSELNQLTLEINRIATNTSFNGRPLLDGSNSTAAPLPARTLLVVNPDASGGGQIFDTTVDPTQPATQTNTVQLAQSISVDSFDPVTGLLNVTVVIGSQDGSFGPEQTAPIQVANGTNFQAGGFPPTPGTPTFSQTDQNGNPVLSFNIGTLTSADVGKSALLVTLPSEDPTVGRAIQINSGSDEGSVIPVDIPGMSARDLAVNDVVVGSSDLQNEAAEFRLDYAINKLAGTRAQVGAQTASLQEAATDNQDTSVNTQASESAIRDLNVGQAATQLARDQVLTQFQTQMIANTEQMSRTFATLVSDSIVTS